MSSDPRAPLSMTRVHAFKTAGSDQALRRALVALSEADILYLARSLEFQSILDGEVPDLVALLRPQLRRLRPERIGSVERLCWRPLERFLTDRPDVEPDAPWIVPRRMLRPLWEFLEAANADLVDQLRRRHLSATFDGDQMAMDLVSNQVMDLGAFILNNANNIPTRLKLSAAEAAVAKFAARVLKWHRLIMPNVRYFQQVTAEKSTDRVQALRLYSNWYAVFELLDTQFDLYVLYLFEMTPTPIDVIDAFPFYFDTLTEPVGLAIQWLRYRTDSLALRIAAILARPPRQQPTELLMEMVDKLFLLSQLVTRMRRLPLFAEGTAGWTALGDALRRRISFENAERLGDSLIDWLHDIMMGTPDRRMHAQMLLGPLATAYPVLLGMLDNGEKGGRASRIRFKLGDKAVEEVDRYLRSHEMAPQARYTTANQIAPMLELCRWFGKGDAVNDLERRLRR